MKEVILIYDQLCACPRVSDALMRDPNVALVSGRNHDMDLANSARVSRRASLRSQRCTLHSRSASASSRAFSVFPMLPRTTRSRWFLIRSSSIVMTLFSGLGVVSVLAAPSR